MNTLFIWTIPSLKAVDALEAKRDTKKARQIAVYAETLEKARQTALERNPSEYHAYIQADPTIYSPMKEN